MRKINLSRALCVRPLVLAIGLAAASCTENAPSSSAPKADGTPNAVLPSDMNLLKQQAATQQPQMVTRSSPGVITSDPTPNAPAAAAAGTGAPTNLSAVQPNTPTATAATPTAAAPAPRKPAGPAEDIVVPPPDAHWTLYVAGFDGPAHVQNARAAREQLKAATNSNKFYVVHEEDKSTIYYGFYKDIDSRFKDGKQAQVDREYLKSLKTTDGQSPLSMVYFTPVSTAAPDAPAEWDLAKIGRSPEHYWTLQIAAYTPDGRAENPGDVADRKAAAVESVRALRKAGVEAYYYHGPDVSSVCVGCWPENAVKRQDGGDAAGNAATVNPTQPLLVADALPPNLKEVRTPEGEKVKALAPRLEILNPDMLAMMKRFPSHAINGYEIMRTYGKGAKKQTVPDPSIVALLPEMKTATPATVLPTDADLLRLQLNANDGATAPQQEPGLGQLKSLGQ